MKIGSILIDHTTNSPELAWEIYKASQDKGIYSIDAPVSGGDIGAINGKLIAMVGGDIQAIKRV